MVKVNLRLVSDQALAGKSRNAGDVIMTGDLENGLNLDKLKLRIASGEIELVEAPDAKKKPAGKQEQGG